MKGGDVMTGRELAMIACRLLGLYVLVMGLFRTDWLTVSLVMLVGDWDDPDARVQAAWMLGSTIVPTLLMLAAGVVLWWTAPWLGSRLAGSAGDANLPDQLDPNSAQAVLFAVAGVVLIAIGGTELIYPLLEWAYADPDMLEPLGPRWVGGLVSRIVMVLLGIGLLLGGRGLAGLITRLRTFATPGDAR